MTTHGVRQIVRFNWPAYVRGACALAVAGCVLTIWSPPAGVQAFIVVGMLAAAYWLVASVIVSHWVYDRSLLCKWDWIANALPHAPMTWVNIHAGLDESTSAIRRLFPNSRGRVLDIFDAAEMNAPSIVRARAHVRNAIQPESANFRRLPMPDAAVDAAFLLLSAHELRRHESRVAFFREVQRILNADGRVVVAEHLRDIPNFLAFGPGFMHFHSRRTWRRAARDSGLGIEREFRITPFVAVFILRRST